MKVDDQLVELNPNILRALPFDLIIAASGYETRSSYVLTKLNPEGKKKVSFGFDNNETLPQRLRNDSLYKLNGYSLIIANGDSDEMINKELSEVNLDKKNNINILIDYSSMTRIWYSTILDYFNDLAPKNAVEVNLFFTYTQSNFVPPPSVVIPNKHVGPIQHNVTLSTNQKPTALIIGLGYEGIRAYGLTEFLDSETFIFQTDSSNDNKYSFEVEKNNIELLSDISSDHIFKYPISDLNYTHFVLNSLCKKLLHNYKIVIAPCGPKPFTLLSLINAMLLDDTTVWRISPGKHAIPTDKLSNGEILLTKVKFHS